MTNTDKSPKAPHGPQRVSVRLKPPLWHHERHVLRALASEISNTVPLLRKVSGRQDRVVDLGSGDAPYRSLFVPPYREYVCCDLPGSSAEVAISPGEPVPLEEASADLVVSFQVLEHVEDLDWYLGEARRLLRPGGHLILSTHGTWLYHPHPTDYWRWTRDGLRVAMEVHGFEIKRLTGVVGPLAWTTQFRLLGYRHVLQRVPLLGGILTNALSLAMNVRMIVEDAITPQSINEDNACVYVVWATTR